MKKVIILTFFIMLLGNVCYAESWVSPEEINAPYTLIDKSSIKSFQDGPYEFVKVKMKHTNKDNTYDIWYYSIDKDTQMYIVYIMEGYDEKGILQQRKMQNYKDRSSWLEGKNVKKIQWVLKEAN